MNTIRKLLASWGIGQKWELQEVRPVKVRKLNRQCWGALYQERYTGQMQAVLEVVSLDGRRIGYYQLEVPALLWAWEPGFDWTKRPISHKRVHEALQIVNT